MRSHSCWVVAWQRSVDRVGFTFIGWVAAVEAAVVDRPGGVEVCTPRNVQQDREKLIKQQHYYWTKLRRPPDCR